LHVADALRTRRLVRRRRPALFVADLVAVGVAGPETASTHEPQIEYRQFQFHDGLIGNDGES
jgi:hypothetical protein